MQINGAMNRLRLRTDSILITTAPILRDGSIVHDSFKFFWNVTRNLLWLSQEPFTVKEVNTKTEKIPSTYTPIYSNWYEGQTVEYIHRGL